MSTPRAETANIPQLDLAAHHAPMRDELLAAVADVIDSNRFILGPEVEALESEVATISKVRYGVGVSSGSDALLVALMALDVGPGDEVITTTYTFFATAGAISRLGATPVFVDIEPHSFNIDPAQTIAAIGERTKAIIPVHLFGRCADMDAMMAAGRERGIAVIEDAAQALGARTPDGRPVGSIGDMTCHSFFPSKNLGGFGDGGMVVSDEEALADRVRLLRGHGARPKYHHHVVGGNFRLDALQAAILRVKLRYLDAVLSGRVRAATLYGELFGELAGHLPLRTPEHVEGHTYNQYVIRAERRDDLREHLAARGIATAIYYPIPLHEQGCFADLGMGAGDLPESERAAAETLALPIFPEMTPDQQRAVVEACISFYG